MKKILLLLCALFSLAAYAQQNYKPGYVIDTNGDTLKGYIDYREWTQSPKIISFKPAKENQQIKKYTPQDIKEFLVHSDKYISYSGELSLDNNQMPNLSESIDTATISSTVFIQLISSGYNVSLYKHSDNIKTRYFIQEKVAPPEELIFHQYLISNNITRQDKYKRRLYELAIKYNLTLSEAQNISKINFEEEDLAEFIMKINHQKKDKKDMGAKRYAFFVGAGLNINNTMLEGINKFVDSKTQSPKLVFGIDGYENPLVKKLIFRAEINFSYNKPTLVEDKTNPQSAASITFTQYNASIAPQIIYNLYNAEKLKFYIGAGASFNFSNYCNNKSFNADGKELAYPLELALATSWLNFPIQTGVFINNKLEVSFKYFNPTAYTKYRGYSNISTQTFNLGINYFFQKRRKES